MPRMRRSPRLAVPLILLGLGLAGCSAATTGSTAGSTAQSTSGSVATSGPGTTVAVAKDILAQQVDPPGATGRTLTLIRYTIAPGAQLAPHVHPGIQLAAIESGELTYTIESGTVTVQHGADGGEEQVTGPTTITLEPGDAVSEVDGMVHFGANDTDAPVVILATLLTESDKDLAVTVTTQPS